MHGLFYFILFSLYVLLMNALDSIPASSKVPNTHENADHEHKKNDSFIDKNILTNHFLVYLKEKIQQLPTEKKHALRQAILDAAARHYAQWGNDHTSDTFPHLHEKLETLLDQFIWPLDATPYSDDSSIPPYDSSEAQEFLDGLLPQSQASPSVPYSHEFHEDGSSAHQLSPDNADGQYNAASHPDSFPLSNDALYLSDVLQWSRKHIKYFKAPWSPQWQNIPAMKFCLNTRSEKWSTLCSRNARLNAENFGVHLTSGNANSAVESKPVDTQHYVLTVTKKVTGGLNKHLPQGLLTMFDAHYQKHWINFYDVGVASDSEHGHRVVVFRDAGRGIWYVLDPYRFNTWAYWPSTPKPALEYFANSYNKPTMMHWFTSPVAALSDPEQFKHYTQEGKTMIDAHRNTT
jgi:hypothetical protein